MVSAASAAFGAAAVALLFAGPAAAEPNTCQPRSKHPFMPIYHIIGNVTSGADGAVTKVEAINDVSSAFLYEGIYHVFHQCCQNHWDHVVSKGARRPPWFWVGPGFPADSLCSVQTSCTGHACHRLLYLT